MTGSPPLDAVSRAKFMRRRPHPQRKKCMQTVHHCICVDMPVTNEILNEIYWKTDVRSAHGGR